MSKITRVWSREILDSRAMPTVETVLQLDNGVTTVASVPSGASTGKNEALELRDGDQARYLGKGVLKAVDNVNNKIGPAIVGIDPSNQADMDKKLIELDGSNNKSNLGANAILSVSIANCKAGAIANNLPVYKWVYQLSTAQGAATEGIPTRVPTPIYNMINGGAHGAGNLDFQEFQIIPASSKPYSLALKTGAEVYQHLKNSLIKIGAIHSVGDEGGYAPNLFNNADALGINVEAINSAGFQIGQDFFLGLDVAASHFYKDGSYSIKDRSNSLNSGSLTSFFEDLSKEYRLILLEDPLQEEDRSGWTEVTSKLGDHMMIVGDDLIVTNPERVKKAAQSKACNTALIKPNQIGTVSETLEVIKLARQFGWKIIVSHRSGETNDFFIADFAVGVKSDFVKFGAPARGERVAKYNRLLSIETELSANK